MRSKQTEKHPKHCPCGCDHGVSWLEWLLLAFLLLTGWLLVKAVDPSPHHEALHDVPTCAACFGLAGGDEGDAAAGGRYVQRA